MPFFYDINRQTTSNGTAGNETTHLWGKTVANQETVGIYGVYAASRFLTAGGGQINLKDNTGATASGGTATTPTPTNRRGNPAAQSTWNNDASAITAGATLLVRKTIGFAQTGGMGGYVPIVPTAAVQMMPNATNPVDVEVTSDMASNSVTFGLTLDIGEGI
jgi:hypothetical protein